MRIIGIDLDEVLAEFLEGMCVFHNERFGTALSKSDFFTYEFWKVWNCTKDEHIKRVHMFQETDLFRNLRVCEGAAGGINALKDDGFELFVITSRHKATERQTREWVQQNFPGAFKDVLFSNNFSLDNSSSLRKSELCKLVGASVLLEDQLGYAEDCAEKNIQVILFDKPWNKRDLDGVKRVFSWDEAAKEIKKMRF